jgi:Uma2 family endonuclease
MTVSANQRLTPIDYPDSDGQPMAESDQARKYLTYSTEVLQLYFQNRLDVYVSGNLFIYYEEGNPKAFVAPDVFVIFGVEKKDRRSYKIWEEADKAPNFVLEITSKSTKKDDQEVKPLIYASLGVQEYFQYDPSGDYLNPPLQGLSLVEGQYQPLPSVNLSSGGASIWSEVLGLELQWQAGDFRFYDPSSRQVLRTHAEAEARIAELEARLKALGNDTSGA